MIKAEFGILAGVSKESVKEFIHYPTLSGRKYINGRQLIAKAKACIKDCKVLLAYWTDYTKAGGFPSGKNEKDALLFCTESVNTENEQNLERENGSDDDEEDDKEPPGQEATATAPTQPLRNSRVVDSDIEDADVEEDDEDNDSVEYVSKKKFIPPALISFMLLGPYSVAAFGFEISAIFSVDTEAIEENAKTGMYNTQSIKEEKKAANDLLR